MLFPMPGRHPPLPITPAGLGCVVARQWSYATRNKGVVMERQAGGNHSSFCQNFVSFNLVVCGIIYESDVGLLGSGGPRATHRDGC